MRLAFECLPVELWREIIREALEYPGLVDIKDRVQDQYSFEQALRLYNSNTQRRIQQEQELTRQRLRLVCHSWKALTDRTFGGWVEVNNVLNKKQLYSPSALTAWRIDCFLIPEQGSRGEIPSGGINGSAGKQDYKARILTINSGVSSIDSFLLHHGHFFPSLQVLDLRPASTFLMPTGGVSAGPEFFPNLSTLFPNLSILLVDLPAADVSDVLNFPRLRRLSYNIIGQSRLSDWERCALIEEWNLPMVEHVSLNPVGCDEDWQLVVSAMKVWGVGLKSLCWGAEFPGELGITIGATDWSLCPTLTDLRYDVKTVHREVGNGQNTSEAQTETPEWHPFHRIAISEEQGSPLGVD